MYFSDDEEEGQFKQRSKRKGGNKSEDSVKSGKSNYSHQRTKHNNHNLHRQSKFEQPTRHHVSHPQHQIPPPPPQMLSQSTQHYQHPLQYQYPPAYHNNGMHPSQCQHHPMYYNNGANVTYPISISATRCRCSIVSNPSSATSTTTFIWNKLHTVTRLSSSSPYNGFSEPIITPSNSNYYTTAE